VQFGLQFEEIAEGGQDNASPDASIESKTIGKKKRRPAPQRAATSVPSVANPQEPAVAPEPAKPATAEVVRLDRFRKK
jgi:hypothetical protein